MMKKVLALLLIGIVTAQVSAQNRRVTEGVDIQIKKSALESIEKFNVRNINGDLKVEGYDGDEILVTGTKTIRKRKGRLDQKIIDEIYLRQEVHEGTVYVFIQAPGVEVDFKDGKMRYSMNWNRNRWDDDYDEVDFEFDLEVKMPKKMMVEASTVNGGEVLVENMLGGVKAGNVNGGVFLKDVAGKTKAHTVNGDIEVYFAENPTEDCQFNTVNGSMEIFTPNNLSAVVTFESLHGDLYTDFEQVTRLKPQLNKEKDGKGYRYRIGKSTPIQIGNGGPKMEFETINGNAYIRKRK